MLKTEKKASKKQLVEHLNILSGDKNFTAYKIKLWQEKTNAFFILGLLSQLLLLKINMINCSWERTF